MLRTAKEKMPLLPNSTAAVWIFLLLVVAFCLPETRLWNFASSSFSVPGKITFSNTVAVEKKPVVWHYDASDTAYPLVGDVAKSAVKPLLGKPVSAIAGALPAKLYHYTGQGNAANILEHGLQPGAISGKVFTTPAGTYTPIEAQMYLGLSPNRGLPDAVFEINTSVLRSLGIKPSTGPMRVLPTPNAKGYGTEIIFEQAIPPSALRKIH